MEISVEMEVVLPSLPVFLLREWSLAYHIKLGISTMVCKFEQGTGSLLLLKPCLEFSLKIATCLLKILIPVETSGRVEKSAKIDWRSVSPYSLGKLGYPLNLAYSLVNES